MRSHKKKRYRLYLIVLLVFMEAAFSGCGRQVGIKEVEAARTGCKIGYLSEEYVRLTIETYRKKEAMPPVTTIEKTSRCMGYSVRLCFGKIVWWRQIYENRAVEAVFEGRRFPKSVDFR